MPEASASGFPGCLNYFGRNGLNNMKQKFYYGLKHTYVVQQSLTI